jgi:tetratricopeptide (TPR) repeat protein
MCFFHRLCFAFLVVLVPTAAFPQQIDRQNVGAAPSKNSSKGDAALVLVSQFEEGLHGAVISFGFAAHARVLRESGDLDRAIVECTEAIRLNLALLDAYHTRALAWTRKGNVDRAIADWSEAIRRNPQDAIAFSNRASAWMAKAEFDIATATSLKQPVVVSAAASVSHGSSSHIDLLVDPDTSLRAVPVAPERVNSAGHLNLRYVAFCEKIENYGRYERFKRDEFKPGQPVLLYAEVEHFKSEPTADGSYRAILKSTIDIFDSRGALVQKMPFQPTEDLCARRRRDYYNSYEFVVPTQISSGRHTLKLTIEDQLSGQAACYTVDFVVK